MILDEAEIRSLATQTLERVGHPASAALVLEGSIAEGFGNSRSDIDFLLVADQEADLPTMPTIFFIDGRRVEIRTRSVGQIVDHLQEVNGYVGRTARRIAALDEHLLNRCQRLLRAHVVHRPDLVGKIRDHLAYDDFAAVMTRWWAEHARQSIRHSVALLALDQVESAAVWARAGLEQAAKSYLARHGETYIEPKWLSLQLDRLVGNPLVERYWQITNAEPDAGGQTEHTRDCIRLVAELGVPGCAEDPQRLVVARAPAVTTWQIDDQVHLVRDRRDVFVLGDAARRVWRRVVWGRPLAELRADAERTGVADAGELIAAYLRYGLIRITWRGVPISPRLPMAAPLGAVTPAPAISSPILGLAGAEPPHPRAIALLPLPAPRFAAAAMALMWGNFMIENAMEDLQGALDRKQWGVAALTTARAVNGGLRALLSAHGVSPLPPDPELLPRLDLLPGTYPQIRVLAERLYATVATSEEDARRLLTLLREYITEIRSASGGEAFPSSFDSADGWQRTLDIGYDLLRLGAYLDQQLPLDEAQDLLSSGGVQPHARTGAATQET
ncbi:hypothetical protein QTQ03_21310 [Micromonospora sp. WMMA1363]|uniref:hypothetical protein n=1 Tax=Micromonospora sp. WMMA1363 TaxID=3053985 RepID=UPI00259D1FDB|nr:hypothetical protein [Micromonospora sp. WMMA1363]MDM4722002.1 hypothetical protein [Micromonospora sp. WMMA1363]